MLELSEIPGHLRLWPLVYSIVDQLSIKHLWCRISSAAASWIFCSSVKREYRLTPSMRWNSRPLRRVLIWYTSIEPIIRSGVVEISVIYRDCFTAKEIKCDKSIDISSFEYQAIQFSICRPPLTVLNIYRPPLSSIPAFSDELHALVDFLTSLGNKLIICGDFNCPWSPGETMNLTIEEFVNCFGLSQHVSVSTHEAGNILDLLFSVDESAAPANIKVQSVHFSENSKTLPPIDRSGGFSGQTRDCGFWISPAEGVDGYESRLLRAWSRYWTRWRPSVNISRDAPWTLWRQLERRWLKTRLESDRQAYRQSCRVANDLIMRSLQNSNAQVINEASSYSQSLWRAVNKLLHPSSSTSLPGEASCRDRCNSIAAFFIDKLENIRRLIRARLGSAVMKHFADPAHTGPVMSDLSPVTPVEAAKAITSMKSKTSPLDILPTDILENCVDVFAVVISKLANLSFEQGIFPTAFKTAQITPLLKKPSLDPELPSSYRPISNLNTISKVLEKLFLARVKPFIMASPNFCRMQSAYRKGHSTETALLYIYNDMFQVNGQQKGNSIGQPRSQRRIRHGGPRQADAVVVGLFRIDWCCGQSVTWVQSYLSNREQFIKIRDHSSRATRMESGIPQGSVLGPFLFSTYMSPLSKIIPDTVKFHQYADDTQLYCSISTSEFTSEVTRLQDCVRDVSDWFLTNCMQLNGDKSEAVLFRTWRTGSQGRSEGNCRHRRFDYGIVRWHPEPRCSHGRSTQYGSACEFSMQFMRLPHQGSEAHSASHTHIRHIRIRKFENSKRHIRPLVLLNQETATNIGRSVVSSRLDYCNSLMYGISKANIKKLQRVQNALIRVICSLGPRDSVSGARRDLHWLPIEQRIIFKIAVLTFNCRRNSAPPYLCDLVHDYLPRRTLRSGDGVTLEVPRTKTVTAERAFSVAAPTIWNDLPLKLRQTTYFNGFKTELKTHLFSC